MATTMTNGWTDYAVLEPSTPQFNKKGERVKWRVQINAAGQWRCYCPSFIFSKGSVKTCKHIRRCQQEQALETGVPVPTAVAAAKHPQWDSAYTICSAMLDHARLYANDIQREKLVSVLAEKLAAFVPNKPVRITPAAAQQVAIGVRHIVFDD